MNQKIAFHEGTPSFVNGLLWSAHLIEAPSEMSRGLYDRAQQDAQEQGYNLNMGPMFIGMVAARGILLSHAAEIAIKTVLQQVGYNPRQIHDLGKLFKRLPNDVKEYAEKQYKPISSNRETLQEALNDAGPASVNLRYLTETNREMKWTSFAAMKSVTESALSTIQRDGTVRVPPQ